ncbi:MAG: P pilus assembly/Cpx signaling pathway, periplasmic inhibitor/zinc-resistance associated protein [Alkalinema sp. RU_4_3]|nr:P pilus assembly/Cpx signaling pathway, periplasmic inhibitor/zinc-resistance associated protein [Alkalinema sp. RU_4_3]
MLNKLNRQILTLAAGALLLTAPMLSQSAQAKRAEGGHPRMERAFKDLNLTEAQKTQMKALRESARTEMEKIFTPEQKAILEAAKKEGRKGDRREVMQSLNLTEAQKTAIKALKEKQRQSFEAILTPEQKAKLEQKRSEMKARYGNRKPAA